MVSSAIGVPLLQISRATAHRPAAKLSSVSVLCRMLDLRSSLTSLFSRQAFVVVALLAVVAADSPAPAPPKYPAPAPKYPAPAPKYPAPAPKYPAPAPKYPAPAPPKYAPAKPAVDYPPVSQLVR